MLASSWSLFMYSSQVCVANLTGMDVDNETTSNETIVSSTLEMDISDPVDKVFSILYIMY